ncbi:MAG: hypothetical protein IKD70_07850 [Eggerthellaceae bacterium]|nr:hypothetical protein [Eggerthellaceae bacterium]
MISEFPLFLFSTLTGIAAGAYAVGSVFCKNRQEASGWVFPLTVFLLAAFGGLASVMHLGRPDLGIYALTQPHSAIAQEAYCIASLMTISLADLLLLRLRGKSPRWLIVLGAIAGLALMVVTSRGYVISQAIEPWTGWGTWLLFIAGDLLMGAGLVALFESDVVGNKAFVAAYLVLAVLTLVGLVGAAMAFAGSTSGSLPFIAAAIIAPVASAVVLVVGKSSKMTARGTATWMFVLAVVGVAIARYFFYAVCAF